MLDAAALYLTQGLKANATIAIAQWYGTRQRLLAAMRASFAEVDFYKVGDSTVLAAYQGPAREPSQLMTRARELDASLRPVHSLGELLTYRVRAF